MFLNFSDSIVYRNFVDLGFQIVPRILWAIVIVAIVRTSIGWVGKLARRALRFAEPTLGRFLVQIAEGLVLVVGSVAILDLIGIQATSLIAVLGAAGIAIGLALQGTLSHFASGVMLITLRPFEVGDVIESAGVTGTVDTIGIFHTVLITADNIKATVPNGNLFTSTIKNITGLGTRRVELEINISDRDMLTTKQQLLDLAAAHPLVLKQPEVTCVVIAIAADTCQVALRPWCKSADYGQVRADLLQSIQLSLLNQG